MQTWYTEYIYKKDFDKACFQMTNDESKDLARRTQSDKILRDEILKP